MSENLVAITRRTAAVIFLGIFAVIGTLATVLWDINQRANEREKEREDNIYLSCLVAYALGVQETGPYKSCEKFKDWIKRNTNVVPEKGKVTK